MANLFLNSLTEPVINEEDGFVVRLRGLPWAVTNEDILDFFSKILQSTCLQLLFAQILFHFVEDANILGGADGIHMTYTREGRATGEGYLELTSAEDVERALKKHNQHLGPRYIEGVHYFLFLTVC